jgi:HEAT repeat protein
MSKKSFIVIASLLLIFSSVAGYLFLIKDREVASPPTKTATEKGERQPASPAERTQETGLTGPVDLEAEDALTSTRAAAPDDPDLEVRITTVRELRGEFTAEAVDFLARFLDDEHPAVVSEAMIALVHAGLNSDELKVTVYEILEERAKDNDFFSREEALVFASQLGYDNRILPVISSYISEREESSLDAAARALSFISDPAAGPYLEVLLKKSSDQDVLDTSARNLVRVAPQQAYDLLLEAGLAEDKKQSLDKNKTNSLAWAVSLENTPEGNTVLKEGIEKRWFSENTVSMIASSPSAPGVFGELLQTGIPKEDKIALLRTLSENGSDASSEDTRSAIAFDAVVPLLESGDSDLEIEAIKTLAQLDADPDTAAEALSSKFESPTWLVRQEALEAFMSYATPTNYKHLVDLYWDEDERVRRTAFFFSEEFLNKSDREILVKATTHTDQMISKHAKIMLDAIDAEESGE